MQGIPDLIRLRAISMAARSALLASFGIPALCAAGELTGTLEAGMQADNRMNSSTDLTLNHLGYLNYLSTNDSFHATADYIVQAPTNNHTELNDSELYQLYGKYTLPGQSGAITAGRFHRFDNLGYYTLDGAQLTQQHGSNQFDVYAGQPRKTDGDHTITGDYLYGVDAHFSHELLRQNKTKTSSKAKSWYTPPPAVSYRVGFQQIKQETIANRLNLGFSYKNNLDFLKTYRQEVNMSSSYHIDQSNIEDLLIDSRFYANKQNYLQLTYERYEPDYQTPIFRERFYASYALGEQQQAEAAFHHIESTGLKWTIAGRKTTRENSHVNGYGYRTSIEFKPAPYAEVIGDIDILTLGDDTIESFWLLGSHSPDAKTRVSIETGLQFENKSLYGFNRATGLRAQYQYMINRDFFLTVSAEHMWNSQKENDYLIKSYLVYYLYSH